MVIDKTSQCGTERERWQARDRCLSEPCGRRAMLTHEQTEATWKGKGRLLKGGKRWRQAEQERKVMSKPRARLGTWVSTSAWAAPNRLRARARWPRRPLALVTSCLAERMREAPWCPDCPTEGHSPRLCLTFRIPVPLCIKKKNLGDSYMQF